MTFVLRLICVLGIASLVSLVYLNWPDALGLGGSFVVGGVLAITVWLMTRERHQNFLN